MASLRAVSRFCPIVAVVGIATAAAAPQWDTSIQNPGDPRYYLPSYPLAFVSADIVEVPDPQPSAPGAVRGDYKIGMDVLSANDPSPGNVLWVFLPQAGAIVRLFPRDVHAATPGLIDGPKDDGSVVEPNLSEDGTRIYFAYFHDCTDAASTPANQGRLPHKGADLYVIDVAPLLNDPATDPDTLEVKRLTFRVIGSDNKQDPADRDRAALNPTLARNTAPNEWGTVFMHPHELRTRDGLKLVYVSNERRVLNSNQGMTHANHNFNLHIADIAADGSLTNDHQSQYYTTTSALSPTPLREGFAFSYQASTEAPRNWHIQGVDSEGRWYPLLGYGSNPELFHLGSFCVTAAGPNPGDYYVAAKYYNLNNEAFGSLWRQDLSVLGKNSYNTSTGGNIVPRQTGSRDITPQANSSDFPSGKQSGQYSGKLASPRCGGVDELYFAYSPTSANGRLRDDEENRNIYHALIGFRPNLEPFNPLGDPATGDGLQVVIDDLNDELNLVWPTPVVPWSVRTGGDVQQQFSAVPVIDPASTIAPGDPFAQVGTSALWNTDRRPFDCFIGSSGNTPYTPQGVFNVNQENDLVGQNQNGWTHVADPADACAAPGGRRILGITVSLTGNKTNLRGFAFGYETGDNGKKEAAKLLGLYDTSGQADQSFQAVIPANAPFEFQLIDNVYGMKLTDVRSWHSLKPRETRTDCGGCHQHDENELPIAFAGTVADSQPPLDLTTRTPYLDYDPNCRPVMATSPEPTLALPVWQADIWPGIDNYCGACHNEATAGTANAAWSWTDSSSEQQAYDRMRNRKFASARLGAIGSPMFWAARGERTDGRNNNEPRFQPDYPSGDWGFFFSNVHASSPGLCASGDQAYASWVYKLGLWIDNHMPRDTGEVHPYATDWFHPTAHAAIDSADCAPSSLRFGYWDDTGQLQEVAVTLNGATVLHQAVGVANGAVTVALPRGIRLDDAITVMAMDDADNRQIYTRSVAKLVQDCRDSAAAPTVFESTDPAAVVLPANAVGTATASPYDHLPATDPLLFYQVDDGNGNPPLIKLVKGGLGVLINF